MSISTAELSCGAIGIPINMFTVMFAIGRMPGWISNYKEIMEDKEGRIYRPRQVYQGPTENHYVPIEKRRRHIYIHTRMFELSFVVLL